MLYDYIIIGGGPSGLTFANLNKDKSVLIIDREDNIGGCHRVKRVESYFTEHGPRVYGSNFLNFEQILNGMNIKMSDIFTEYKIDIKIEFTLLEIVKIIGSFLMLIINDSYLNDESVNSYMERNNFSKNSIDFANRICLLTDGAGADRYTINQFLELLNQNIFYKLYQPKKPNDELLFQLWRDYLIKNNVIIKTKTNVRYIKNVNDQYIVSTNNESFRCKNLILAIPPKNLVDILKYSDKIVQGAFIQNLDDIVEKTKYKTYISMMFYWNKKYNLKGIYGVKRNDWGIIYVVLSEYMTFKETNGTVISVAISLLNNKSSYTNKTPNESNRNEILIEAFRQINISLNLPSPDKMILSPNNYRLDDKVWENTDTSYVNTYNGSFISPFTKLRGMYTLGTHNGNSYYKFTSIESACSNAIYLSNIINKENKIKLLKMNKLSDIIKYIIIMYIIYIYIKK